MDKLIILIIIAILLIIGCTNINNIPTKKVEDLFNDYQTLDEEVLNDLNITVDNFTDYNQIQKDKYKEIIKKQYRSLIYKIRNKIIGNNHGIVIVEVTVKDLYKVEQEVNSYINNHKMDTKEYIDYKLNKLMMAKDKVTYTIEVKLTKNNNKWCLNGLSNEDINKISGTYAY